MADVKSSFIWNEPFRNKKETLELSYLFVKQHL